MVERRADDGEAFGPHELGEEGGDAGEAVAGDAAGGAGGLELLRHGQREERAPGGLNVAEEAGRDAVVGDLEDAPCLACMAYEREGIGVVEVNDRDAFRGGEQRPGRGLALACLRVCPCIGLRELLEGAEVEVFVVEMDGVGFEGIFEE